MTDQNDLREPEDNSNLSPEEKSRKLNYDSFQTVVRKLKALSHDLSEAELLQAFVTMDPEEQINCLNGVLLIRVLSGEAGDTITTAFVREISHNLRKQIEKKTFAPPGLVPEGKQVDGKFTLSWE